MFAWQLLLFYALVCGLALSLVLTLVASGGAAIARDMFVDGYPPAIKHAYGSMSRRAAAVRPYVAALLVGTTLVVPVIGLFVVQAQLGGVSFGSAVVFAGSVLLVFNFVDLLILDWLVFCTIQPRAMVLPGTEGMAAYGDYGFHAIGFLKGLGFTVVGSLLIAVAWTGGHWLRSVIAAAA